MQDKSEAQLRQNQQTPEIEQHRLMSDVVWVATDQRGVLIQ